MGKEKIVLFSFKFKSIKIYTVKKTFSSECVKRKGTCLNKKQSIEFLKKNNFFKKHCILFLHRPLQRWTFFLPIVTSSYSFHTLPNIAWSMLKRFKIDHIDQGNVIKNRRNTKIFHIDQDEGAF